jgi:hypothetical protein
MLGFIFGFNARMGRLNYFVCSAVVNVASQFGMVLFAGFMFQLMTTSAQPPAGSIMSGPLYAVAWITVIVNFMLRSMRIRDIGWDPALLVPAWIGIVIADKAVAAEFPAWAIGHGHLAGTMAGSLIDTALAALLIFMPSAETDGSAPMDERPLPEPPPRQDAPTLPTASPAPIATPTRPAFGRRQAGRLA